MTSIQKLKELGESLGYKDTELQLFVKEQQAEERTQRNLDREAQLQAQLQADKMKMEADRTRIELERMANEQKDKDCEITRLELEIKKNSLNQTSSVGLTHVASGPKLPCFEDEKDDMDAYLSRFERVAEIQSWRKSEWAIFLSSLLKGKALEVYSRLPSDQAGNYDVLRKVLLRRYELTEDGFIKKIQNC